jgi:hypothetical protein
MSTADDAINWMAVGALYAGLGLGLGALLYWGEYRNALWLLLIGSGGACTAYGRVLAGRGRSPRARWWKRAGAVFYAVFFVWAGTVLFRTL